MRIFDFIFGRNKHKCVFKETGRTYLVGCYPTVVQKVNEEKCIYCSKTRNGKTIEVKRI